MYVRELDFQVSTIDFRVIGVVDTGILIFHDNGVCEEDFSRDDARRYAEDILRACDVADALDPKLRRGKMVSLSAPGDGIAEL